MESMRLQLFMLAATVAGCAPPFDPTRVPADPGTFGQRVVTLMCKRLAYQADRSDVSGSTYRDACKGGPMPDDAPGTLLAIAANRDRLVTAIDHVVPADVYDPLQAYLTSEAILSLYDDDTMSNSIASLGSMLIEMGSNTDAMAAFARMGIREHYRAAPYAIGPAGPLTGSAKIRAVMDNVLPSIIEGGASKAEWDALVAAISFTLSNAGPQNDGTGSTAARIASTFLLTEHPDLGETSPVMMVRRDPRGIAKVALVGGVVPAPFVDVDADLLADVDAGGSFVDANGAPVAAPDPFPASATYEYFDLTKTLFGSMANDQMSLLDPARSTAVDLLRGAAALLGPRVAAVRTGLGSSKIAYQGYDTSASPLLDLAYAFVQLLRDPNIGDTLDLTDTLMEQHRPVAARLLEAAIDVARLGDDHTEAEILANAPLWDDLRPQLQKVLDNPKLTQDLMTALERPEVRQLLARFRDQMKYKDRFDIAPDGALTGTFATVVDRTQPDSGFNRSLWQRLLHLISDSNGAVECSKAGAQIKEAGTGIVLATYANECDLFRVENMAVFYLQSTVYAKDGSGMLLCETTAGAFGNTMPGATPEACVAMNRRPRRKANFNYNWGAIVSALITTQGGDAYLETRSTIPGFRTHPTSEALNRALFQTPRPQSLSDTSDPPKDKFGALLGTKHVGTLPVWEKDGFYDSVRPILQAFADSNQEQIFVDMMSIMHKHWSTAESTDTQHTNPAGPNYTMGSRGVTYEPYVQAVFEGDLWPALTEHAAELNAISVNGKPFHMVARNAGRFLVSPLAGLTDREGNPASTTADGKPVAQMSPWDLLADAYHAKRTRIAASAEARLWNESMHELVDLMFRADLVGSTWTFRSKHMAAASRSTTKLLRDRLAEHTTTGDRATWIAQDLPEKISDVLTHPLFAGALDFVESQTRAGAPRDAFDALLYSVFDRVNAMAEYDTMRVGAADLIQLAVNDRELVPLARMVGGLLDATKTYLPVQLGLLHRMHGADTESTLTNIVARLFKAADPTNEPGIPAISVIADGVGDVDRYHPGPPADWSMIDYVTVFRQVGWFMHDEKTSMPRFVTIIKGRSL